MSADDLKRLDRFTMLFPPHFSSIPSEDVLEFLDYCHEILCNLELVESNGVDFTIFRIDGSPKR